MKLILSIYFILVAKGVYTQSRLYYEAYIPKDSVFYFAESGKLDNYLFGPIAITQEDTLFCTDGIELVVELIDIKSQDETQRAFEYYKLISDRIEELGFPKRLVFLELREAKHSSYHLIVRSRNLVLSYETYKRTKM